MSSSPGINQVSAARRDWPLHGIGASRSIEQQAADLLEPHTLMRRAGASVAKLAMALAPHAQRIWVPCGPGNNGGDGLDAAAHLHRMGSQVFVSLLGDPARLPDDAKDALARAQAAGVLIQDHLDLPFVPDMVIDALLGLGAHRAPSDAIARAIAQVNRLNARRLAVDLPSGLHSETGQPLGESAVRAEHTLSLLTLKPGLFTGRGRDHAGDVWFDPLGISADAPPPQAWLGNAAAKPPLPELHVHHKGSYGDVAIVGGAPGMSGAAWLAGRAAHAAGAGRVYVSLLDSDAAQLDLHRPELMVRRKWWASAPAMLGGATVVCGCGGGEAVRDALPTLLSRAGRIVLDADALNAIAADDALATLLRQRSAHGTATVMTPHPLEAARLLACTAGEVQADRLRAADDLAQRHGCVVVLKGSGSIIAAPGRTPIINATGNALLATAGTGDVLAGWIGGLWSRQAGIAASSPPADELAWMAARHAVHVHGRCADTALAQRRGGPLRAADLVEAMWASSSNEAAAVTP